MNPQEQQPRQGPQGGRENIPDELHPKWDKQGGDRADQPPSEEPEVSPSDPDIAGIGEENRPA